MNTIFMRSNNPAPGLLNEAPPTPASVSAGIRQGARLRAIGASLDALWQRREEVLAALGEQVALRNDEPGGRSQDIGSPTNREILRLGAERERIDAAITAARREALPLKTERAGRVAEALAPMTTSAASQALAAVKQLREAVAAINGCAAEIERAGGDAPKARLPDLDSIEATVRRLAAGAR